MVVQFPHLAPSQKLQSLSQQASNSLSVTISKYNIIPHQASLIIKNFQGNKVSSVRINFYVFGQLIYDMSKTRDNRNISRHNWPLRKRKQIPNICQACACMQVDKRTVPFKFHTLPNFSPYPISTHWACRQSLILHKKIILSYVQLKIIFSTSWKSIPLSLC
jgi:hypothetical protein